MSSIGHCAVTCEKCGSLEEVNLSTYLCWKCSVEKRKMQEDRGRASNRKLGEFFKNIF